MRDRRNASEAPSALLRPLEEESRKSRSGAKCVAIAWNLATPFGENIPKYFFLFVHLSSALLFSLAKRHLFHWSPSRQEYFCSSCTIKGNPNTRCKMEMRSYTLRVAGCDRKRYTSLMNEMPTLCPRGQNISRAIYLRNSERRVKTIRHIGNDRPEACEFQHEISVARVTLICDLV